ncbi:MAG: hypothetical protein ACJ74U_19015 [Jatrophihabitantaceae bacterium]
MSKTFKDAPGSKQNRSGPGRGRGKQRNISVRAVRREPPDLRKLSRALIQLAIAEAEAEAQQAATDQDTTGSEPAAEQEPNV